MPATQPNQSIGELLRVENLRVAFKIRGQLHDVLKGINFRVAPGSVVALVGESGSGKSVTTQAALGLLPANGDIRSGSIILFTDPQTGRQTDLAAIPSNGPEMRAIRGSRISMIFQEPMTSLSPLHTIGDQVSEALVTHHRADRHASPRPDRGHARPGRLPEPGARFRHVCRSNFPAACASAQ